MPARSSGPALAFFASFPVALAVSVLFPLTLFAVLAGCQRLERFTQGQGRSRRR